VSDEEFVVWRTGTSDRTYDALNFTAYFLGGVETPCLAERLTAKTVQDLKYPRVETTSLLRIERLVASSPDGLLDCATVVLR
jgi:hypothetical protein